jgi:hypothetical protein
MHDPSDDDFKTLRRGKAAAIARAVHEALLFMNNDSCRAWTTARDKTLIATDERKVDMRTMTGSLLIGLLLLGGCAGLKAKPLTAFPAGETSPTVDRYLPEFRTLLEKEWNIKVMKLASEDADFRMERKEGSGVLVARSARIHVAYRHPDNDACKYYFIWLFQESTGPNAWGKSRIGDPVNAYEGERALECTAVQ